ncbi:shikimate dehydrogenase [Candidatus Profftia sp. (ex Adelges kitamiensis)]|uniref:shikimate dehydrogenase n=1 Tax=Candidatus Profftia sp. (ex Adelges kitamiensis) TaxID=2864218 RepID=UPI001CE2BE94|nr:shikimate dehydrogenase [Candidatus Profftia sp. (ex Adelges kitamiensis)]
MKYFAVFGNPIKHSKSPRIHQLFSQQTGIPLHYEANLTPVNYFQKNIKSFFINGAMGANITTPFKEQAYNIADQLTERALLAKAVNTLKLLDNGKLLGDNTDGIGLINDIKRIGIAIVPESKILLLGAGGAARGIIQPILSLGCSLTIANRTYNRAQELVSMFSYLGKISSTHFSLLSDKKFDIIINATSSGINGEIPNISPKIIDNNTACYDLFYQKTLTPFLSWAQAQGARHIADGFGMLVAQAAYSFLLWHGVMPNISSIIKIMHDE